MEQTVALHKAGAILIKDRRMLVTRSRGKTFFIAPGGKLESGETPLEALVRELTEELSISVRAEDVERFGTFYAPAAGEEHLLLQSDIFLVRVWSGEITPDHEIEEVRWIASTLPPDFELGSIVRHDVLPRLKEQNLID